MLLIIKIERKDMAFTLTRNFKVHLYWDRDEIIPASREMLDRRWANVVSYVGATSANDVGPMWICPSVQRWHNVVTPPTMTLCQRFANVITYCILLYFMVIGTTFAQCLYEWLAKHWHNFMKQWCPLYVFLHSYSLSPIACRRLQLR